jgi:hypothetical protein
MEETILFFFIIYLLGCVIRKLGQVVYLSGIDSNGMKASF